MRIVLKNDKIFFLQLRAILYIEYKTTILPAILKPVE